MSTLLNLEVYGAGDSKSAMTSMGSILLTGKAVGLTPGLANFQKSLSSIAKDSCLNLWICLYLYLEVYLAAVATISEGPCLQIGFTPRIQAHRFQALRFRRHLGRTYSCR